MALAGEPMAGEFAEAQRLIRERSADLSGESLTIVGEAAQALRSTKLSDDERLAAALAEPVAAAMEGPWARQHVSSAASRVFVDRSLAGFGSWYELFPRSYGGFQGTAERLVAVAEMGFDIVYLPPIHPIGHTARKGVGGSLEAGPGDPGSPWAIGNEHGGHDAVNPELGTMEDFEELVARAKSLGLEIALDYALQCSPDHPWVKEHPEWFTHRADGTIAYAENPPKKYQDIVPINFWPHKETHRVALWNACADILRTWIDRGVKVFRVDNPHTKPVAFWEWCIGEIRKVHPDVIFLAEAFTRPKMMAKLAEIGFSQSYTYFTWRTGAEELADYGREVNDSPTADYMRPNFWPTTPDILSGPLRRGPRSAFAVRAVLAATMSPNYGIYSGYELGENEPASDTNEEFMRSEKYEVKVRSFSDATSLAPLLAVLNQTRRRHRCLQRLGGFWPVGSANPDIFAFARADWDMEDIVLVAVNLNYHGISETTLDIDLDALGLPSDRALEAHDELSGERYIWEGRHPYLKLDPATRPAHVISLRPLP